MDDYALVLNAGSSSLKFCVYSRPVDEGWRLEARGQIDGIGTSPRLTAKDEAGASMADEELDASVKDGRAALDVLAGWLRARYGGARVLGVGHRVVHGGAKYAGPCVVTPEVLEDLRALMPLAPLHQPYNLAAIEAVSARLPGVPQVACFDTSFHRGQPAVAELVPLPKDIRDTGVQRYGFHGLSYEYIASVLPEVAPDIADGRVIVAHLGSGASLCALKRRKSVDSTLGFTALDGLCMGTRPGAVDPGVILHLFQTMGLSADEVEAALQAVGAARDLGHQQRHARPARQPRPGGAPGGGLLRLPGREADRRARRRAGRRGRARLHRRDRRALGRDPPPHLRGIGLARHGAGHRRQRRARAADLHPGSRVSAWVIPTNEELMIARHTAALLGIAGRRA